MGRSSRNKQKNRSIKESEEYKQRAQLKESLKAQRKAEKDNKRRDSKQNKIKKVEEPKENYHFVGLYGTFRKDQRHYGKLNTAFTKYIGIYETEPIYNAYSIDDGVKCGITEEGFTSITMEVYKVTEKILEDTLDFEESFFPDCEDFYSSYLRKKVDSPYGKIWIYIYNNHITEKDIKMDMGDWVEYLYLRSLKKKSSVTVEKIESYNEERPRETQMD